LRRSGYDLFGLAQAQQAVVNENAGQLAGHRSVNQGRAHG